MTKLKRHHIICIFFLSTLQLYGQSALFSKNVIISKGKHTLKSVLSSLSSQTGYEFSYDPSIINDRQWIIINTKQLICINLALDLILPKNIEFNIYGKYIVLHKIKYKADPSTRLPLKVQPQENELSNKSSIDILSHNNQDVGKIVQYPDLEKNDSKYFSLENKFNTKQIKDSIVTNQDQLKKLPNDIIPVFVDQNKYDSARQVFVNKIHLPELQKNMELPDNIPIEKGNFKTLIKKNGLLEIGLSSDNRLGLLTFNVGIDNIYSILSVGIDYNNSSFWGIGLGSKVKINSQFGLNFNLSQNTLFSGKSYVLKIRTSNTQFTPQLYYSFGRSFKLLVGPIAYLINSSYVNSNSTTDLGSYFGIGLVIGLKVDLKSILKLTKSGN